MSAVRLLLVTAVVLVSTPAQAQWAVWDAATTGKNYLTFAQREIALQLQRDKSDVIRRMGRSLDLFAPLNRYRMPGAPLMRTRWPDGLTPRAMQFVDLLNGVDTLRRGYAAATVPVAEVPGDFSTLGHAPSTVREEVRRRLGLLQFIDGGTSTSADLNGRVRAARKPYREALDALESVVTTSADTTKVAAQIAAGSWIKAQQEQTNLQLAIEINRQTVIASLMEREATAGALLYSLGTQRRDPAPIDSPLNWSIH